MNKVKTLIEGIVPLTMDAMSVDRYGEKSPARPTAEQLQKSAESGIWKNEKGLYIPGRAIKKCILRGAWMANLKVGRASLSTYLEGALFVIEKEVKITNRDKVDGFEEFIVRKKDGNSLKKRRAFLNPDWQVEFNLVVAEMIDLAQLKIATETAGLLVGLGNGRPEYGRFEVKKWELVK